MIFQHTWRQVLDGSKTQTRRLIKSPADGTAINGCEMLQYPGGKLSVARGIHDKWGIKWQVGKTYAVQPGRGEKAAGRIQITNIRRQDVREISPEDVAAEGYAGKIDFLVTWASMHDKSFELSIVDPAAAFFGGHYTVNRAYDIMGLDETLAAISTRPEERYRAWVLEFELITK